jgi:hypothetical protein
MIYSVWNQGRGQYSYYAAPDGNPTANAPAPKHIRPGTLGVTPTQASWPLPTGAKLVGHGDHPRGRVATRGGLAGFDIKKDWATLAIAGLAAWVLWKNR